MATATKEKPKDDYTTGDIARIRGVSRAWVHKIARQHGIGRIVGRMRIFSRRDYRRIMAIPLGKSGRPPAAT